jgi:hypothetical protein
MAIFRRIVTSLVNQVKTATITSLYPANDLAPYPKDNLKTPEEPYTPVKASGAPSSSGIWDIDLGATGTVDYIGFSRVNFLTMHVQGSNVANFATSTFSGTRTVTRSPLNGRYNLTCFATTPTGTTPMTGRYFRVGAVPQATVAESMLPAQTNYLMGGIFMGTIVYPPLNWLWDVEFETIHPRKKQGPDDDSWEQVLITGNQRLRLRGKKIARTDHLGPSTADELARYMEYDRSLFEAEFFALCLNSGDPSCALVVRNDGDRVAWQRTTRNHVESSFELVEVIKV